jgi:spermidine synthase
MLDRVLILSVFIAASCGLAYELIAGALTSYLLGDSILQFSSVIGCYLFAMGVGSHLSKYIRDEQALRRFIEIELLVGLIGGTSAALLFLVFAWMSAPFRAAMYAIVFFIGVLVGMEIPLVMRILNMRKTNFSELVSRVLTFDYLGALAVSLLFPLVLAPHLGLSRTGFLFGICNAAIAIWTTRAFRHELPEAGGIMLRSVLVLCLLAGGFLVSEKLTRWAEHGLYGDEIIHAENTPYQRIVITRWKNDMRLYLNGNLQFSSIDEHRYHEALIHPALSSLPWAQNVLVIGGGDGLAVRELLKYPNLKHITLVDLDAAMTGLFRHSEPLLKLNQGALNNPRVQVINDDAARWLEANGGSFDAIVVDLPDPSNFGLGKLYSVPFFTLLKKHLAEQGYIVIQSTSPYFAPRSFWCVNATLREAGFNTWPYHNYVPSFGDWGFILAGNRKDFTPPTAFHVPLRYLDAATTVDMFRFPKDMTPPVVEPNRLDNQSLVHYFQQDWAEVIR